MTINLLKMRWVQVARSKNREGNFQIQTQKNQVYNGTTRV